MTRYQEKVWSNTQNQRTCESTRHTELRPKATERITLPCGCVRLVCAQCAAAAVLQKAQTLAQGITVGTYTCPMCNRTTVTTVRRLYRVEAL